jgi:hypothetical protein
MQLEQINSVFGLSGLRALSQKYLFTINVFFLQIWICICTGQGMCVCYNWANYGACILPSVTL